MGEGAGATLPGTLEQGPVSWFWIWIWTFRTPNEPQEASSPQRLCQTDFIERQKTRSRKLRNRLHSCVTVTLKLSRALPAGRRRARRSEVRRQVLPTNSFGVNTSKQAKKKKKGKKGNSRCAAMFLSSTTGSLRSGPPSGPPWSRDHGGSGPAAPFPEGSHSRRKRDRSKEKKD